MSKIKFDTKRCKGCGMCVLFCPMKHLRMSDELNDQGHPFPEETEEDNCTACGLCFRMCPDTAIEVKNEKPVPVAKAGDGDDRKSPQ
ncbi:MAG: 4Fe-4S dicluster domain-containing protein [Planctomycetota bacterium]|jgi:2-oxoglutarate ferredoxin oxidoreductase subunit delta